VTVRWRTAAIAEGVRTVEPAAVTLGQGPLKQCGAQFGCEIGYLSSEGTRVRRRGFVAVTAAHGPRFGARGSQATKLARPASAAR